MLFLRDREARPTDIVAIMAETQHVVVQTAREWITTVWVAEEHDSSDKRVERFRDLRGSSMDDLGSLTV